MKLKKRLIISFLLLLSYYVAPFSKYNKIKLVLNEDSTINHNAIDNQNTYIESILVTLNPSLTYSNEDIYQTIFKDFDRENIEELATIPSKNTNNKNFKRIFYINLSDKERYNYVSIKQNLLNLEGVYSVDINAEEDACSEPNDERYISNEQWGLNSAYGINAPEAWDYTIGTKRVRVGVIDSGIADHVDLHDNLVTGYDFVNDSLITSDVVKKNYHGTQVAGIIGAVGNNTIGITGVNWNVQLVPLQTVNSSGKHTVKDIIKAINYATEKWGSEEQIDIINHSIEGFGEITAIRSAIENFPGLFVWSAGNNKINIDELIKENGSFNLPNLISVGSINQDGERRVSSNYSLTGSNVNLYAPGGDILTTNMLSSYTLSSGTSMAAPFVTGTAALLLSLNHDLTANELKRIILDNSDLITIKIPSSTSAKNQLVRKLNAGAAISSIRNKNAHVHKFESLFEYVDSKQHRAYCECGSYKLIGLSISSSWNGSGTTKCLVCGGTATIGYVGNPNTYLVDLYEDEISIVSYFGNWSYLLSDGIYVISDADLESFLNGLLELPINN